MLHAARTMLGIYHDDTWLFGVGETIGLGSVNSVFIRYGLQAQAAPVTMTAAQIFTISSSSAKILFITQLTPPYLL
jgi:hypothetical protein